MLDPKLVQVSIVLAPQGGVGFHHQHTLILHRVRVHGDDLIIQGNADLNGGALLGPGLNGNGPVHGFRQLFYDAHAQACALDPGHGGGVHALERLEDALQEFLGHADPVILTRENQRAPLLRHFLGEAHGDFSLFGRVFHGV